MSRVIMNCPPDKVVDHINRDKLDNRKCNLRIVSQHQNLYNKPHYQNTSQKYKGAHFHKRDKVWMAQIMVNSKIRYLGKFETEEQAAYAYNVAALEHFGEYANLNDVPPCDVKALRILKEGGSSKYRGVNKDGNIYTARITYAGKREYLGCFKDEIEAAKAYNAKAKQYGMLGVNNV